MEKFREFNSIDEFIDAMEMEESEPGIVTVSIVYNRKRGTVTVTEPDGASAEIPFPHFTEIIKKCGEPCPFCSSELILAVIFELEELIFTGCVCNACNSYYVVSNGELQLYIANLEEGPYS